MINKKGQLCLGIDELDNWVNFSITCKFELKGFEEDVKLL